MLAATAPAAASRTHAYLGPSPHAKLFPVYVAPYSRFFAATCMRTLGSRARNEMSQPREEMSRQSTSKQDCKFVPALRSDLRLGARLQC